MTEEVINEQETEEVTADESGETESNSESEDNIEADNDESPETSTEEEKVENSESDGGESEEVQNPAGSVPEWVEKRLKRERRKQERLEGEVATLKEQSNQFINAVQQTQAQDGTQFDPNFHVADSVTGQVLLRESVEGQVVEALQKREQLTQRKEAEQRVQSEAKELKTKFAKGYDKYDDYQEVIDSLPFTNEMLQAVSTSDNVDDFVYSLGKNRFEDVERISKLPPKKQYKEMVKLELEFEQSKDKKIVKAVPKPPATVKGDSHIEKDPEKMSFDELFAKAKRAEEAKYGTR